MPAKGIAPVERIFRIRVEKEAYGGNIVLFLGGDGQPLLGSDALCVTVMVPKGTPGVFLVLNGDDYGGIDVEGNSIFFDQTLAHAEYMRRRKDDHLSDDELFLSPITMAW